jgi:hypothetical protein
VFGEVWIRPPLPRFTAATVVRLMEPFGASRNGAGEAKLLR